jgi:hypothetical protein
VKPAATYRNAAKRAETQLRHSGLCPFGLGDEAIDALEDVASYLDTTDPTEIGAGALLETSGYQRTQLTLEIA